MSGNLKGSSTGRAPSVTDSAGSAVTVANVLSGRCMSTRFSKIQILGKLIQYGYVFHVAHFSTACSVPEKASACMRFEVLRFNSKSHLLLLVHTHPAGQAAPLRSRNYHDFLPNKRFRIRCLVECGSILPGPRSTSTIQWALD